MTLKKWCRIIGKQHFRVFLNGTELTKKIEEDGQTLIAIAPKYLPLEVVKVRAGNFCFDLTLETGKRV